MHALFSSFHVLRAITRTALLLIAHVVLSVVYFAAYVPGVFAASWLLDTYGLRAGLLAGVLCCAIGAVVRGAPCCTQCVCRL